MTKVTIISGFLGAGKTTLIKKLLAEAFPGEQLVLIENEFGQIGIDSAFLKESGVQITEMNSGCICCSLVGDFTTALGEVVATYAPQRILIEPSGVGKLSDVVAAVERASNQLPLVLDGCITVVDGVKCKLYLKNFGEFFSDQVSHATAILLSRTQDLDQEKLAADVALLRGQNALAPILTTPWDQLTGAQILAAMAGGHDLAHALLTQTKPAPCACGHDHDHDLGHDHGCTCGHDHDPEELAELHAQLGCDGACGSYDLCDGCLHATFHHHAAEEVFTSWGRETPRRYSREELQDILAVLSMTEDYGTVLRAKGMLPLDDGSGWIHFDLVPGEFQIRAGGAEYTGRLCVIGSGLDEEKLATLFLL